MNDDKDFNEFNCENIEDEFVKSENEANNDGMQCTKEEFDKLLTDNINFPYSVVNKEFSKYPWNVRQELGSAAMEGMVYAATKYNPKRSGECKFISYAVHWIRYYIYEEIRKLYPVRFNQNFVSKRKKVMNCINDYKKNHNDEMPTVDYISGNVGMTQKVVKNILNVNGGKNFTFLSFNIPVESDKSGGESEALNSDRLIKEYLDAENLNNSMMDSIEFKDMMECLKQRVPKQDYQIFYDYYINGENFSDLAKKYKLKFPSSAAYLIKKCEKKYKELMNEAN